LEVGYLTFMYEHTFPIMTVNKSKLRYRVTYDNLNPNVKIVATELQPCKIIDKYCNEFSRCHLIRFLTLNLNGYKLCWGLHSSMFIFTKSTLF